MEILPKSKRAQYEELLSDTVDDILLNELLENEILDNSQEVVQKLELIKAPRRQALDRDKHYDLLDKKHLPPLHHGYLVQVILRSSSQRSTWTFPLFLVLQVFGVPFKELEFPVCHVR